MRPSDLIAIKVHGSSSNGISWWAFHTHKWRWIGDDDYDSKGVGDGGGDDGGGGGGGGGGWWQDESM